MRRDTVKFGKPCSRTFTLTAAAALTAGAVTAGTSSAKPARAQSAATTVHVIEHAVTDTEISSGGGKDVKGNVLTFNNPVFNGADTKRVGHDEGFCIRIAPKQGIWECLWTTFLKAGQITVQGPFYDTRNSAMSITGGTGAYRNSRGEMALRSRNGGKEYDFIFKLS
jgi:allene oxide cyclase